MRGQKRSREMFEDKLPVFDYNRSTLEPKLYDELQRAEQAGSITPEQARAIQGKRLGEHPQGRAEPTTRDVQHRESVGSGAEQARDGRIRAEEGVALSAKSSKLSREGVPLALTKREKDIAARGLLAKQTSRPPQGAAKTTAPSPLVSSSPRGAERVQSMEELTEQAQSELRARYGSRIGENTSFRSMIERTVTKVKEKVNAIFATLGAFVPVFCLMYVH